MKKPSVKALVKEKLRVQASNGGKKTLSLYGKEHFSNIAKKGWKKRKKRGSRKAVK
jgi:hypothetical protein